MSLPPMVDLGELSNAQLLERLRTLVRREREITLEVLLHLNEMERRKLHLLQYSSLFSYCTDLLGYSRSAAWRRLAAARCLRDYPRVHAMLADGYLNLTTVCVLARALSRENEEELLIRAAGLSEKEVEHLVASYSGPGPRRDSIRAIASHDGGRGHTGGSAAAPPDAVNGRATKASGAGGIGPEGAASRNGDCGGRRGGDARENRGGGSCVHPGGDCDDASEGCGMHDCSDSGSLPGADRGGDAAEGCGSDSRGSSLGDCDGSDGDHGSNPASGAGSGVGDRATGRGVDCGVTGRESTSADSDQLTNSATSAGTECNATDTPAPGPTNGHSADATVRQIEYRIGFTASEQLVQKLERARSLASRGRPGIGLADVLEKALDAYLYKHDPEQRQARRQKRASLSAEPQQAQSTEIESSHAPKAGAATSFARGVGLNPKPSSATGGAADAASSAASGPEPSTVSRAGMSSSESVEAGAVSRSGTSSAPRDAADAGARSGECSAENAGAATPGSRTDTAASGATGAAARSHTDSAAGGATGAAAPSHTDSAASGATGAAAPSRTSFAPSAESSEQTSPAGGVAPSAIMRPVPGSDSSPAPSAAPICASSPISASSPQGLPGRKSGSPGAGLDTTGPSISVRGELAAT